jgi:hypothetical protein
MNGVRTLVAGVALLAASFCAAANEYDDTAKLFKGAGETRSSRTTAGGTPMTHRVGTLALATLGLFAANVLFASEPAGAISKPSISCEAQHPDAARSAGDALMKKGDYQRAGQCYLAAGEYDLANRAFLRAAQPAAVATGHAIVQQREAPRALFKQVKSAFHGNR